LSNLCLYLFFILTHSKKFNRVSVDKLITLFDKIVNKWYNSLTNVVWDNLSEVERGNSYYEGSNQTLFPKL